MRVDLLFKSLLENIYIYNEDFFVAFFSYFSYSDAILLLGGLLLFLVLCFSFSQKASPNYSPSTTMLQGWPHSED